METVQQELPQCFVYGLVDPETRLVFYIGISTVGLRRPRAHRSKGWNFEIVLLEAVAEPAAPIGSLCPWLPPDRRPTRLNELERYWIALGRAFGWPLRNRTDGGDGMRIDGAPETRARMSASHNGKKHDAATRAKISAAIKARIAALGSNTGNVGFKKRGARRPKDLAGVRFGRLVTLSLSATNPVRWNCLCDCGTSCVKTSSSLRGGTRSCGCLSRELAKENVKVTQTSAANAKRAASVRRLCADPDWKAKNAAHLRALRAARSPGTHCKYGHELTPTAVRIWRGRRICIKCDHRRVRAFRARQRVSK